MASLGGTRRDGWLMELGAVEWEWERGNGVSERLIYGVAMRDVWWDFSLEQRLIDLVVISSPRAFLSMVILQFIG